LKFSEHCYNDRVNLPDFQKNCSDYCHLSLDKPILVGFSGGADSLSLLILLQRAGFEVFAAHFNHHLRDEADRDEQAAGKMAASLGIPFFSGSGDVNALVKEKKLSVEEAARQSRYQWLLDQAEMLGVQAVAVAHTADDQVETVLMHLLRGTGLDGLTGMPFRQIFPLWNPRLPVVRPLLSIWRKDTEAICKDSGLVPVQDESNQSTRYFRNRIRLELIPYLQEYNPQIKNHLLQTACILADEQSIIEMTKEDAWAKSLHQKGDRWVSMNRQPLETFSEGLRRSTLRRALVELKPDIRDIDFQITERLSEFVLHGTRSGEMHVFSDIWAEASTGGITLWRGRPGLSQMYPQLEAGKELQLTIPGIWTFPGWRIELCNDELSSALEAIHQGGSTDHVWLDADRLSLPLLLRRAYAGERIAPLGMGGKTQKLSDYWVNHKIPRLARQNWPLVVSGSDIIWVAGVGISEKAAVTPETRQVVRLSLQIHQPGG